MAKRRKAGEGTLTKRKDGRWEARVVVSYDEKGMPKTKNVTAVSKAKCLEKLEKLKAELGAITKKTKPTMPFGEWMDFWYQTYCKNTLKESTQATYEQRIYKQIIPKLGHIPMNQLNAGTLEKFYAQLKSNGRLVRRDIYGPGLANSVIRSIHAHCRAALEKAVAEKLIRQNPAIGASYRQRNPQRSQYSLQKPCKSFCIKLRSKDFMRCLCSTLPQVCAAVR